MRAENYSKKIIKSSFIFQKLKLLSDSLENQENFKNLEFSKLTALPNEFTSKNDVNSNFPNKKTSIHSENNTQVSLTPSQLNGYSKIQELKLVKIGLASSDKIVEWAEKILPNGKIFGEVLNANTLHYKTFKPHKGGLFCERIFGPLKDFECACGHKKKPFEDDRYVQTFLNVKQSKRIFCPNCDVEYTWSVIRRYQLGYIKLISPVSHLWYLRANPSYLSLLLDIRKKDLESIIYCMQITTLEYYWRPINSLQMNLTPSGLLNLYQKSLQLTDKNFHTRKKGLKLKFKKKQLNELEKRKKVPILQKSIDFIPTTLNNMRSLENDSLEAKIQYLEKSFELSSNSSYSNTLDKTSKVKNFLRQKISKNVKKRAFLTIHKNVTKQFYKETYFSIVRRTFFCLKEIKKNYSLSGSFKIQKSFSLLGLIFKNYLYAKSNKKSSIILQKNQRTKQEVTQELVHNVVMRRPKARASRSPRDQMSLRGPSALEPPGAEGPRPMGSRPTDLLTDFQNPLGFWYNNNTYSYVVDFTQTKNILLVDQSTMPKLDNPKCDLTQSEEKSQKINFLNNFLILIHKIELKNVWESIYKNQKNSIYFAYTSFNRSLKTVVINENQLFLDQTFKNIFFLYLLFIIQENIDSFLRKPSILLLKEQLILTLLSFKNLKRQVWLNFSEKNKHLLSFLNRTEELDFLSRFLQTNLLLHQNKKTFHFFEIQQILQNSQNNFVQYLNILLNKITTVFFKISYGQGLTKYLTTNQKEFKIFSMEKQQVSYPKKPHNSECFPFSKKTVALNSFQNYKNSKVHQLMFQRLSKEKKIHPFLKFQPADSFQYVVYLKNLSTIKKKLSDLKNKTKHSSLTLFNNIYTVAYSNGWQTEKDWRYFLYYNTASVEMQDQRSSFYKHRFISESFSGYSFSTAIPILGANLTQKLLFQYEGIELKKMAKQHQNLLPKLNRYIRYIKQVAEKKSEFLQVQKLLQKRDQIIRRLKLLRKLFKKNVKPSAAVLNTLPVLPPDLRPILKMQNQIAASDFNRFYQRILYRNERLKKFLRANASMVNYEPGFELKYAQRLLQEAVDNLIQNGKGQVKPETNSRGQPLKSLSEILKGKQGRFRQYLLGKRIDYSGRSVIVVGPNLKISQCGLPFEMAIELFLPFLIKRIFQYKLARTVIGAKTILKTQKRITWNLLEEIMQNHPILLNRAPTLHRLGIQAFQAKLIEGRAILLHPLVCPAFNADFDGDQMAVHVPITVEARTEAWKLMSSRNHLISPATGEPMLLPSQDMILGCYYLTTELLQISTFHKGRPFFVGTRFYFLNMQQVLLAYQQQKIHLQTPIWIKWNGSIEMEHHFSQPLEIRLNSEGSWIELRPKVQKHITREGVCDTFFVRTTAGRVLFNSIIESCVQNL